MIDSSGEKTNIDVGYFGARGFVIDLKNNCQVTYPDIEVTDNRAGCLVM